MSFFSAPLLPFQFRLAALPPPLVPGHIVAVSARTVVQEIGSISDVPLAAVPSREELQVHSSGSNSWKHPAQPVNRGGHPPCTLMSC